MKRLSAGAVLLAALTISVSAQAPPAKPSFEVASIKPDKGGDERRMLKLQPGGGINAANIPLGLLITWAYDIQDFQLVDLPQWARDENFDIVAKSPAGAPPASGAISAPDRLPKLMMQSLLEERFRLKMRTEQRPTQVYALTLARPDGKLGPNLKTSSTDCAAMRGRGAGPEGGRLPGPPAPGERPPCAVMMGEGNLSIGGMPIGAALIRPLSMATGRIVIDRTNLTGPYDIELTWTPDRSLRNGVTIDPNGPNLFTALQEQLGLKLESVAAPVDVFVVEHVERPTPD